MRIGALASAVSALLVLALPKCPICIAAWLSVFGLGAGVGATIAPAMRPLALVFVITAGLLAGWARFRFSSRFLTMTAKGTPRRGWVATRPGETLRRVTSRGVLEGLRGWGRVRTRDEGEPRFMLVPGSARRCHRCVATPEKGSRIRLGLGQALTQSVVRKR